MLPKNKQNNEKGLFTKVNQILGNRKIFLLLSLCLLLAVIIFLAAKASFTGLYEIPLPSHGIKEPGYIHQSTRLNPVTGSQAAYQPVQNFKKYMDSLAHAPSGKSIFDSIVTARPGLLDSIFLVDQLYSLPKNNQ